MFIAALHSTKKKWAESSRVRRNVMFFFLFSVITMGEGERVIKLDSCNFHLLDFIGRKKSYPRIMRKYLCVNCFITLSSDCCLWCGFNLCWTKLCFELLKWANKKFSTQSHRKIEFSPRRYNERNEKCQIINRAKTHRK